MTPYGAAFGWLAFLAAAATLAFLRAFYVVNVRPALRARRQCPRRPRNTFQTGRPNTPQTGNAA